MTSATAGLHGAGMSRCSGTRGLRRAAEVLGVLVAFFWFWPAAAGYVAWKLMGYPGLDDMRAWFSGRVGAARGYRFAGPDFASGPFGPFGAPFGSGNAAFDEYRRSEIERLEAERRRLDEEAREFREFVNDLKRAKDREEFDAYMRKRRANGPTTA